MKITRRKNIPFFYKKLILSTKHQKTILLLLFEQEILEKLKKIFLAESESLHSLLENQSSKIVFQ